MRMDLKYISIFRVSGIKLPDDKSEMVIINDNSMETKIVSSSDIDSYCFIIDRSAAIGIGMLQCIIGGGEAGSFVDRIEKEIKRIRNERKRQFGDGPFVLFEFSEEVDTHPPKSFRDVEDYVVSYELVDKNQIRNQFKKQIERVLMSFFLVVERDYEVKKVIDGVYLLDDSRKVWYSFSISASGKVVVSKSFNDEFQRRLSNYSNVLTKTIDLEDVYRLLVRSSDKDSDNLNSFLFGWTALEVFVNKIFKDYEQRFFTKYIASGAPSSAQQFFDRLRNEKNGKYNLKDKFLFISACLSNEPDKDLKEFVSAKKVRDKLLHGVAIDDNDLPTEKIVLLLRKYLQNHLESMNT